MKNVKFSDWLQRVKKKLRHDHYMVCCGTGNLFRSEFCTNCGIVLLVSNFSTFFFPSRGSKTVLRKFYVILTVHRR